MTRSAVTMHSKETLSQGKKQNKTKQSSITSKLEVKLKRLSDVCVRVCLQYGS